MLSQVEIKCRNCGDVQIIGQKYEELAQGQYALLAAIATKDIYKENPSPYIVDGTNSAFKTLGFTRNELIGREVRSFDPLMESGAYGNLWKLIVERDFLPFSLEVYQSRKKGGFIKARSKAIFQHTKEAMYLLSIFDPIGVVEDVPNRGDLSSLQPTKNIFCSYLLELDCCGVCDSVTYEFSSLLGYLITSIVNKPFVNLYPKDKMKNRSELIDDKARKRQSFRIRDDIFLGKNGKQHAFDTCFTVRYTDNGVFNGFLLSLWPTNTKNQK